MGGTLGRQRRRAILRAWRRLPEALRGPHQALGRQNAGCAATVNVMEQCNFSCTACYLSTAGNDTPPLPFPEVQRQLRRIRDHLGPGGNVQITGGEVTLLPAADLARIVAEARRLGLDPMVMTNGEVLRDDPGYLPTLVRQGGLGKIAVHVDTTQRGRRGAGGATREVDLHPVRDGFARLIRETRRATGQPLHAAHTVTVTDDNLVDLPDVLQWQLDHVDAFRMISFQPVAAVGRTRERTRSVARERLWRTICDGLGVRANPHAFVFGHPHCSQIALLWVVRWGRHRRLVEVHRRDARADSRFMSQLLGGGLAGYAHDAAPPVRSALELARRLASDPLLAPGIAGYVAYRAWTERRWLPAFLRHTARHVDWSIHPLAVVVHHFMDRDTLSTAEGRERLEACAFRVPHHGDLVPMCVMNATPLRQEANEELQQKGG